MMALRKSRMMYSIVVALCALSLSSLYGPTQAATLLSRHVRATMMIDMRGYPDTEGLCRGPGFWRNESDCTQFYRCVDYNPLDDQAVYTRFRFMCGPMAVFDESRGLCTGPALANPPCTNLEQLMELFPNKPMMLPTGSPTLSPPTPSPIAPTGGTPSSSSPIIITSAPIPDTTPSTTSSTAPFDHSVTTEASPVSEVVTLTTGTTSTSAPDAPLNPTTPDAVEPATAAVPDSASPTPTPTPTVETSTASLSTTSASVELGNPVATTAAPAAPEPVPVSSTEATPPPTSPTAPFVEPVDPTTTTSAAPAAVSTDSNPVSESSALPSTTPTPITEPFPSSTESSVAVSTETVPSALQSLQPTTAQPATEPPSVLIPTDVGEDSQLLSTVTGVLLVYDNTTFVVQQSSPLVDVIVPPNSLWAIVSPGGGLQVTIQEGREEASWTIPPGALFVANTTQPGGIVTNTVGGSSTTSTTVTTFPSGTSYWIVIVGAHGHVISWQTLRPSTTQGSQVIVPSNHIVGPLQLANGIQIVSIGTWSYTSQYVITNSITATVSCYAVLTSTTTSTTSSQVVMTTSSTLMGGQSFSGIITIGGHQDHQTASDLVVSNGNMLAIIPDGGLANMTVIQQDGTQGSINFAITPGTFMVIVSSGSGSVTNLVHQGYTTSSTVTTLPAGSTVTVSKVGLDGTLVVLSTQVIASSFTVVTSVKSYVGIISTSSTGLITFIGQGAFSILQVAGHDNYFGLINLNTFTFETLTGILSVGDKTFLEQSGAVSTVQIPASTTCAVITSGSITIAASDGTSTTQTVMTVSSGGILGIATPAAEGGQASNLASGYFTTSTTVFTFPSGATFGILVIRSDGSVSLQNTYTTSVPTTVTVPSGGTFGSVTQSADGFVTGIGAAWFTTQYLLMSESTVPSVPSTLSCFGVLQFQESFRLSNSAVVSTTQVSTQLQTISAIIQLYYGSQYNMTWSPAVASGSSMAIIPVKGQGSVMVNEGGTVSTFTLLPGQIFGLFNVQSGQVTNLGDGFFTTRETTIAFGSGTTYGIIKVGLQGQVVEVHINRTTVLDSTVTVAHGSTIGVLLLQSEEAKIIGSIGGASFTTNGVTSSSSTGSIAPGSTTTVGVLDIAGYLAGSGTTISSTTETATTATTTTASTAVAPITKPPYQPINVFNIECSQSALHQYPLDCSRFYQCYGEANDRVVYIFPCAPGLFFDETASACLNPSEVFCADNSTSVTETTDVTAGIIGGVFTIQCTGLLYRYPLNCNNFYQCFQDSDGNESIYVFSCATGLVFDEPSRKCLQPSESDTCAADSNLFRVESLLFQLGQKIDSESLISSTQALIKKAAATKASGAQHTNVADHVRGQMGHGKELVYMTPSPQLASVEAHQEQRQHTPRKIQHNTFGARLVPRSRATLIR